MPSSWAATRKPPPRRELASVAASASRSASTSPPAASSAIATRCPSPNPNRPSPRAASAGDSRPATSSSSRSPRRRRSASATAFDVASSIANRLSACPATMRSSWLGCSVLPTARNASIRPCAPTGCTQMWCPRSTRVSEKLDPSGRDRWSSLHTDPCRSCAARPVAASACPCRSSSKTQPVVTAASEDAIPSTPSPSRTAAVSTCCASTARCRTSYCSARSFVNTASVIAMNGTGYGTSNSGTACFAASVTSARGTRS